MEIKYEIPDDKVRNFTGSAKRRLQEQSQKYTLEIISEAEKVEELIRENGASTEITDNIIFQAVRRNRTEKKFNNCNCSHYSRNTIICFWLDVLARNVCYDRWRSKYGIPRGLLACDINSIYSNNCYILYRG